MRRILIRCSVAVSIVAFVFVIITSPPEDQRTIGVYDSAALKSIIGVAIRQSAEQILLREKQQNELMGLTITILVGIVGFSFSKDKDSKQPPRNLLMMALIFVLFMHSLDAMLQDMNNKQT